MGNKMKISARNVLKGKVKRVVHGSVNSEVIIELPGGVEITSVITESSAENLDLKEGHEVYAVIKATSVMIASD
jgi:molybdopterin-binding protein